MKAINRPPRLRSGGFDLWTGEASKIVEGRMRRVALPGIKVIEVWRDGFTLFIGDGSEFLCWGTRHKSGQLRLNPLVLCETAYGFASLVSVVFREAASPPAKSDFEILLSGMHFGGKPAEFLPGPLGTSGWLFGMTVLQAPSDELHQTFTWSNPEIDPGAVAFRLVREVYLWFGMEENKIPYTSGSDKWGTVIDPGKIVGVEGRG